MALEMKRYTRDEIRDILYDMFWNEMATATDRYECTNLIKSENSIARQGLDIRLDSVKIYRERLADYEAKANDSSIAEANRNSYKRAVNLVEQLLYIEECSTAEKQKEFFEKDKNLFLTRSTFEFPLDKRINALYDDLSGVFLMYDDIATLGNNRCAVIRSYGKDKKSIERWAKHMITDKTKREEFLKLKTVDARCKWLENEYGKDKVEIFDSLDTAGRIEFMKKNIIVSHVMLGVIDKPQIAISVEGEMSKAFTAFDAKQTILPEKFADFANLTLQDTFQIKVNDMQQWIQTKIDFDRENLKVIDTKFVGDDEYRIEESPNPSSENRFKYYIRYVCPSTQRVYHNPLNEENLRVSKYYKQGDPSTFIYAWWHINNNGEDPCGEEGKMTTRV